MIVDSISSSVNKQHNYNILIVDDTVENVRFLSRLLREHGFQVRQALTGEMAIAATQAVCPDLILLDITMPGMNGYEVCAAIKSNSATASARIIFLSALDDTSAKVKAFENGGVDYITKPFQFEEILARIQTQLTLHTLQQELTQKNDVLQATLNELQAAQADLVQREKMVGLAQLAAGFCHEINNPVSFIAGNLSPTEEYLQDLLELVALYQTNYPNPTPAIRDALDNLDLDFMATDVTKMLRSMRAGVERIRTVTLALRAGLIHCKR